MNISQYFFKKLRDEMMMIEIRPCKPKNKIRLDPVDPQDLNVDFNLVSQWSRNNSQLLHLIMQNGMAQFICNYEFIYQHYEQLIFKGRRITQIDSSVNKFRSLLVLDLCGNGIRIIQRGNLPQSLQELYVDYNFIESVGMVSNLTGTSASKSTTNKSRVVNQMKPHENLVFLSISHNMLKDENVQEIVRAFPELRCMNVAFNYIQDVREFVGQMKKLRKIKILSAFGNPISLLRIYYDYLTANVPDLKVFDNEKYVKLPEPLKRPVENKPQPKQQAKQQKKDPKKDPKKDNKKGSKQSQPTIQQKLKTQPQPQPVKKQLTQQNFRKCSVSISFSNFQNFSGNIYDPSILNGTQTPIQKTQSCFWLSYEFMGTKQQLYEKKVRYDEATILQNQPAKLTFNLNITNVFDVNQKNKEQFQKGIFVQVHSQQPAVQTNPQNGQQKVTKQDNQTVMKKSVVGEVFIDLRQFYNNKNKKTEKLFRLWEPSICSRPYFKDRLPNEETQINKRKDDFQQKIKNQQEERLKKLEEQEPAKNQKKGGKDTKKADKKPQKKQGKQVVSEKKVLDKSNFPLDSRIYCYLSENRLHKSRKQNLAIKIQIF